MKHLIIFIWVIHIAIYTSSQSDGIMDILVQKIKNNESIIELGEVDHDISPSVLIKRMADIIMDENSAVTHNISYKWDESEHSQIGMIVDGKPVVMGAYSVTDPNGSTIMTVYKSDKDGHRPMVKVKYRRGTSKLRESLVG